MSKINAIASDHAGPDYKKRLIEYLTEKGYTCLNMGTDTEYSVDYPIYADKVCKKILSGEAELGILICGTGIGMSIAANKHKGIRAGLCGDPESASLTRQHNNANILAMGGRVRGPGLACKSVDTFLDTPFSNGERHIRRLKKIDEE